MNKGRPKGFKHPEETKKRMSLVKKGKPTGIGIGSEHPLWKGEKANYRNKHRWVEVRLGKPRFCEDCGNKTLKHRQYHWSNISGLYKRVLSDWRRLCIKCHRKFDDSKR